jgi:hypothetical protein
VSFFDNRFRTMSVISVCFLALGALALLHAASFVLSAEPASAVVVAASSRGSGQYRLFKGHPEVVRFSDVDGIEHTATVYYGQPGRHPRGSTVQLLYKPSDPVGTARYGDFGQLWAVPSALVMLGAISLVGAFSVRSHGY